VLRTQIWALLKECVERSQAANDLAQQSRTQHAPAERRAQADQRAQMVQLAQMVKPTPSKKVQTAEEVMQAKSGILAPKPLRPISTGATSAFSPIHGPSAASTEASPPASLHVLNNPPSWQTQPTKPALMHSQSQSSRAALPQDDGSSAAKKSKAAPPQAGDVIELGSPTGLHQPKNAAGAVVQRTAGYANDCAIQKQQCREDSDLLLEEFEVRRKEASMMEDLLAQIMQKWQREHQQWLEHTKWREQELQESKRELQEWKQQMERQMGQLQKAMEQRQQDMLALLARLPELPNRLPATKPA
jgi:hypothetical protein